MGELVLTMFTSQDGYIAGPGGEFVGPPWSADMQRQWSDRNIDRAGALLYGRVNFEFNAPFWTSVEDDADAPEDTRAFARRMHELPKLVFSRSAREVGWNGRVVRDGIPAAVAEAKAAQRKDLVALGGAGLAQTLLGLGLVDRIRLMRMPLVLGDGIPLFRAGLPRSPLELVESISTDTGCVISEYRLLTDD